MSPRYPPLPKSEWSSELQPYVEYYESRLTERPVFEKLTKDPRTDALIGPFPFLIASKEVGKQLSGMLKAFEMSEAVQADVREVGILVAGAKFDAAFEQYAHYHIATKYAGLSHEQCADIKAERKPQRLSSAADVAYDVATYLVHEKGVLPSELYEKCVSEVGREGTLVLLHYVGLYSHFAILMNALDVPLPEGEGMPV